MGIPHKGLPMEILHEGFLYTLWAKGPVDLLCQRALESPLGPWEILGTTCAPCVVAASVGLMDVQGSFSENQTLVTEGGGPRIVLG